MFRDTGGSCGGQGSFVGDAASRVKGRRDSQKPRGQRLAEEIARVLPRTKDRAIQKCMYVQDLSMLVHAGLAAITSFKEHDVFISDETMRDLGNYKTGQTDVSDNARKVISFIDRLTSGLSKDAILRGVKLPQGVMEKGNSRSGRLFLKINHSRIIAGDYGLDRNHPEDKILLTCLALQEDLKKRKIDQQVILVSKNGHLRIRATTAGVKAEDFLSDKVMENAEILYTGVHKIPYGFWKTQEKDLVAKTIKGGKTEYLLTPSSFTKNVFPNEFLAIENKDDVPLELIVRERTNKIVRAEVITDYTKKSVWGIRARNEEQNYGFNLLMDPNIDLVILSGRAGSGKTLFALAAGLEQVIERGLYSEIIFTRATVSTGEKDEDIGFLPGTEEEKMTPWMGALMDNLEVLSKTCPTGDSRENKKHQQGNDWGRAATNDFLMKRIKIRSMNFMRGRTFLGKYLIVDEVQNLTSKKLKTIVTRAGAGTKVVFLGNNAQIDTAYLNEASTGLVHAIVKFNPWGHSGHVAFPTGERSRLADFGEENL